MACNRALSSALHEMEARKVVGDLDVAEVRSLLNILRVPTSVLVANLTPSVVALAHRVMMFIAGCLD